MKLRAVKPLTYATRRLIAGDVFETVRDRDARVLLATKKVEKVRAETVIPPPPPEVAAKIAAAVAPSAPRVDDDLLKARAEYREALGRMPFHAWDAATLREKIAAAKST